MKKIALVGLSGSGKTTLGPRLAESLSVPFHDVDSEIMGETGQTIGELFEQGGETVFRELETEVLERLTGLPGPRVLSTGGGIVVSQRNRRLLKHHCRTIWLNLSAEAAAQRLQDAADRPLLAADPLAALREQVRQREPWYREVAAVIVDVGALSHSEALGACMAAVSHD